MDEEEIGKRKKFYSEAKTGSGHAHATPFLEATWLRACLL